MRDYYRDPQTPEEWDIFLFTKWGYGLYECSYVVAHEIWKSDPRYMAALGELPKSLREGRAGQRKQIRERIKGLENLKKRIVTEHAKDLRRHGMMPEGEIRERDIRFIRDVYPEVDSLFQKIEKDQGDYREELTYGSPWIRKGHLTDTRNKIAFIFAQIIKKENGQPNWAVIRSLLIWFWKRIKKAAYSNELAYGKCPVFTEKTLSNAYSKAMKNPEKKSSIEQSARHYFSIVRRGSGLRIEFKKNYIMADTIIPGDIGSRYPTVVFPDGKILKDMLNLEEAASFLDVPPVFLERLCEKELVPFWQSEDQEEMIFSRRKLMEWRKETFGDRPIFKRKLPKSNKKETCDKENIELNKTVVTLKTPLNKKREREQEKSIRIVLSKRDYEGIQEYKKMRENEKKESRLEKI